MTFHVGDPYHAEAMRNVIKALYATGLLDDVRVEATRLETGGVALRLVLTERRMMTAITVSGNHFISDAKIIKAAGFVPGEAFTETRWERSVADLIALYQGEGYYQARPSLRLRTDSKAQGRSVRLVIEMREGNRTRIRALHFTGDPRFSPTSLRLRMQSQPGEYFHADVLRKDMDRLLFFYTKRGYLKAEIGVPTTSFLEDENSIAITIPIFPSDPISLIFENPAPFSPKTLREQVLIQKERRDDQDVLEESARQMVQLYQAEGYTRAVVKVSSGRITQGRREVRFTIQRGPQTHITDMTVVGNTRVTAEYLLGSLPFEVGDVYISNQLDEAVTALTQRYKQEGFGAIHITGEVAFSDHQEGARITFSVEEGVRTEVRAVRIVGDTQVPDTKFYEVLHTGMPYYPKLAQEGERLLTSAYTRTGYLHATVATETRISEDGTVADITYRIHAGLPIHLGEITLDGNVRTEDRVLLRELRLTSGARYLPQEILLAQRRLYRTGLFSSVRFEPISTPEPQTQDLTLHVLEQPAVTLAFGAGYAEHERFRTFLEVADRNLWGTGNEVGARAEVNGIEETYVLNFRQPWFFSPNLEGRASISKSTQKEVTFDLGTLRAGFGVDRHFSETLKGTLRYEYEQYRTSSVEPAALEALEDTGKLNIATVNLSLVRDTRDDPFQPRNGRVYSATLRNAAAVLGSEVQLVKISLQGSVYHALSDRVIVAASARVGIADRFGGTVLIPPPERFFSGGRNSVRGYPADQLGIQDAPVEERTRIDGQPTGGNAFLVFNEELRMGLPRAFGLILFLDHGNVWQRYTDMTLSQIKSTIGTGLRYNTLVGPLRLDWGYKLNREEDEEAFAFHFALGHAF